MAECNFLSSANFGKSTTNCEKTAGLHEWQQVNLFSTSKKL